MLGRIVEVLMKIISYQFIEGWTQFGMSSGAKIEFGLQWTD